MNKLTLEAARVNAGYTIKEVSQITGISAPTIIGYEKKKTDPRWSSLKKLISLYKVKVDNLDL